MLDILNTLATLKPYFRGAIFLTYTLDLVFFEELIVPKLDALGCTNVVILADRHGYDEALLHGERYLRRVGRQYVCQPVTSKGRGVQHAKAILLLGPRHGWLLVGSGNLTLPGIGRNLEQFVQFDLDLDSDDSGSSLHYPFSTVWRLINSLSQEMGLSSTTTDRLQAIREMAPWLEDPAEAPPNLQLWHSFDQPILSQWQENSRQDELRLLSPFWTVATIDEMVNRFRPQRLILGLNGYEHQLDGAELQRRSKKWPCTLELVSVTGPVDEARRLHAKTFIGANAHSSWCVTGSANCTAYGLQQSWRRGGNLELVTWQFAESPNAFDDIWTNETLQTSPLDLALIDEGREDEITSILFPFRLSELQYDHSHLSGKIEWIMAESELRGEWWLELRRSAKQELITPDQSGFFQFYWEGPLDGIEAGRAVLKVAGQADRVSPFHWVDQPDELVRFGNRTYHARMSASLQTFSGAGQLFEELLNFLWERVDPVHNKTEAQGSSNLSRGRRGRRGSQSGTDDSDVPPPPASSFVTDERLTSDLIWHVEGYSPYHQSTYSLRDLLSLALLRLTVGTKPDEREIDVDDRSQEEELNAREIELNKERKAILQQLCNYVHRYCRQYAARLTDKAFVKKVGPQLLFENHFTLGRVLLEFYEKVHLFTDKDLRRCLTEVLGALFWPAAIGQQRKGGWELLLASDYDDVQLQGLFRDSGLPTLIVVLMAEAWGKPRPWQQTRYQTDLVQQYMFGKELIRRMVSFTTSAMWEGVTSNISHSEDLFGFRNLRGLNETPIAVSIERRITHFKLLKDYRTPAKERYDQIFLWGKAYRNGLQNKPIVRDLQMKITNELGYDRELNLITKAGKNGGFVRLVGSAEYCPSCFVKLPLTKLQKLKQYELVLCPSCLRAVLYWEPSLPLTVI